MSSRSMERFKGAIAQRDEQPQVMPGEALVASGETMEKIQTQYHTAVRCQVKRSKREVLQRVLEECEILPDGLLYSWTVNNKNGTKSTIEGPSIRLAMTLAREYGNCVVDSEVVAEDETHWTFRGSFVDLETGFTTTRLFRQRKSAGRRGKFDVDRLEDMQFQIGQSKAIRNAVVNAMPSGILVRAQEAARAAIAGKLTSGGIKHNIAKAERAFKKYGVTRAMLEGRVGKKVSEWDGEDLADIRAIYVSLEEGMTTAEQEFAEEPKKIEEPRPPKKPKVAKARARVEPEPEPEPEPPEPPVEDDIPIPDEL